MLRCHVFHFADVDFLASVLLLLECGFFQLALTKYSNQLICETSSETTDKQASSQ